MTFSPSGGDILFNDKSHGKRLVNLAVDQTEEAPQFLLINSQSGIVDLY